MRTRLSSPLCYPSWALLVAALAVALSTVLSLGVGPGLR